MRVVPCEFVPGNSEMRCEERKTTAMNDALWLTAFPSRLKIERLYPSASLLLFFAFRSFVR